MAYQAFVRCHAGFCILNIGIDLRCLNKQNWLLQLWNFQRPRPILNTVCAFEVPLDRFFFPSWFFGWALPDPFKRLWFCCVLLLGLVAYWVTLPRAVWGLSYGTETGCCSEPYISQWNEREKKDGLDFFFWRLGTSWPLCERLLLCHSLRSCYWSEILYIQFTAWGSPGFALWDTSSHFELCTSRFIVPVGDELTSCWG